MTNPCKDCLVESICIKMCPKVIEFYKPKVKRRTKDEIEQATGYLWYEDSKGDSFSTGSMMEQKIEKPKNPLLNFSELHIEDNQKERLIDVIINFIKKGLQLCLKNRNILRG